MYKFDLPLENIGQIFITRSYIFLNCDDLKLISQLFLTHYLNKNSLSPSLGSFDLTSCLPGSNFET